MASDNKYDRQLRLWGAAGQKALMESRILLLTGSATGTETLKNLVLPGCGFVTVVDSAIVSARDLANNFFVTAADIGKPRAQVTLGLLLEMNDDVKGDYVARDPVELVTSNPVFLSGYSLIVATQLPEHSLRTIAAAAWERNVPLLAARTFGLIGYLRLIKREHLIVESKLETMQPSLRVARPFPGLQAFADGIHLNTLDDMTHGHVPYVVLLTKALAAWKAGHGGQAPKASADKEQFKALVASGARGPGGVHDSANFGEALKMAYLAWADGIPSDAKAVLSDPAADSLCPSSPDYWFVVRAIRDFVHAEGQGELPLSGVVPDMTATTELFLALQRTYSAKAAEDVAAVAARVAALLSSVGRPADSISTDYIAHVCKHAAGLRVVRYRSLDEELSSGPGSVTCECLAEELTMAGMEATAEAQHGASSMQDGSEEEESPARRRAAQHPLAWYVAIRAADRFAKSHGRYPGSDDGKLDSDTAEVATMLQALASELGIQEAVGSQGLVLGPRHAAEVCRYGGAEVHAVAGILGGVAAQEAVKLLTGQYVPLDNTFVYNGVAGNSGTYRL